MRRIAALDVDFARYVGDSLAIIASTEVLWLTAPPASEIRKQLKVPQLEALYESVYLRIFSAWESFIEDVLVRFMSGYMTGTYQPVLAQGCIQSSSIRAARVSLYGPRGYALWYDPIRSADRVAQYVTGSPLEAMLRQQHVQLKTFATIRHRIAHDSDDAKAKFKAAALLLASSQYSGRPGKLLRAPDMSDPLNQPKWILRISTELIDVAHLILKLFHQRWHL
jgi:hypothetical protein